MGRYSGILVTSPSVTTLAGRANQRITLQKSTENCSARSMACSISVSLRPLNHKGCLSSFSDKGDPKFAGLSFPRRSGKKELFRLGSLIRTFLATRGNWLLLCLVVQHTTVKNLQDRNDSRRSRASCMDRFKRHNCNPAIHGHVRLLNYLIPRK